MAYLILIIGLIIGSYFLFQFLMRAKKKAIKSFFLSMASMLFIGILQFLTFTGRLPLAISRVVVFSPIIIGYIRHRLKKPDNNDIIDVEGEVVDEEDQNDKET